MQIFTYSKLDYNALPLQLYLLPSRIIISRDVLKALNQEELKLNILTWQCISFP